ncbi:MAG: TetR/AcrR family transcriptional regulator [Hyphomicrobiaceae bacterium]
MPRLKPETHRARRENILDAAEHCFARSGFHRTTMQDICRQAGISAGALYVYFNSKEALIAGLCERDRAKLAFELTELAESPDLMAALARLGEHYAIDQPREKRVLFVEMGAESTRNDEVGEIFRSVDRFCINSFAQVFERARAAGRIAPAVDTNVIAQVIALIGDGLFWRRAVDPDFDAKAVLPVLIELIAGFVNPTGDAGAERTVTTKRRKATPEKRAETTKV